MSDQSPPSEPDQLGWLMGEVDRLRAELEQEREARHAAESLNAGRVVEARENWSARVDALEAELEQARKERDDAKANASYNALRYTKEQRYRDALERLGSRQAFGSALDLDHSTRKAIVAELLARIYFARDALAGEGQA